MLLSLICEEACLPNDQMRNYWFNNQTIISTSGLEFYDAKR